MELSDIQALAEKLSAFAGENLNEETTKHALVIPFVKMLGYDPGNPLEVAFEYTADFGTKASDRVDIAILKDGSPILLMECKPLQATLDAGKCSQLYRYFAASVGTRVGVLTNGRKYMFFSDLDAANVMDSQPFLSFDLLSFDRKVLPALQKLGKKTWDLDSVMASAGRLKHLAAIKEQIMADATEPDDDVVKRYANVCYEGKKTAAIIEHFRPLIVQAFRDFISDRIADRLAEVERNAQAEPPAKLSEPETAKTTAPECQDDAPASGIVTHDSEIHAYLTVKTLVADVVSPSRVVMRDRQSYCGILLDDNNRKPICRLYAFQPIADDGTIGRSASIHIFTEGKNVSPVVHKLATVDDIIPLAEELRQAVRQYLPEEQEKA